MSGAAQGTKNSEHEVVGGSFIRIPMMGRRLPAVVPSGTKVMVPKSGHWHVRVPGGTNVTIGSHKKNQVSYHDRLSTMLAPSPNSPLTSALIESLIAYHSRLERMVQVRGLHQVGL